MSNNTQVIHRRDAKDGDVYIGRGSRWGNPYHFGKAKRERKRTLVGFIEPQFVPSLDLAIECYRVRLWQEVKAGRLTVEDLAALHGKRLVCFCAPKPCHGDVLAKAAEWAASQVESERDVPDEVSDLSDVAVPESEEATA